MLLGNKTFDASLKNTLRNYDTVLLSAHKMSTEFFNPPEYAVLPGAGGRSKSGNVQRPGGLT